MQKRKLAIDVAPLYVLYVCHSLSPINFSSLPVPSFFHTRTYLSDALDTLLTWS